MQRGVVSPLSKPPLGDKYRGKLMGSCDEVFARQPDALSISEQIRLGPILVLSSLYVSKGTSLVLF